MTAKQENKVSMFHAVQAVCDRNTITWQVLQAFADGYTDFGTHVTNIQKIVQNQSVNSTGLTADKEQLRKAMAKAAVELAGATNSYAKKIRNNDLAAKTNVSITTFMEGRDTIAPSMALNIHAVVTANLASLATYGITAAKLTAFKTKIDAYSASITKPRDAVDSGSTATKQLAIEIDGADAALEQMDPLLVQFEGTNPTFVSDYRNARIIVDNVGPRVRSQPTVSPTPPPP
jgi:hypothetical protein